MHRPCAIIYMNLGPYHIARLCAVAQALPDTHVIEVATQRNRYPWMAMRDNLPCSLQTLFPGKTCEEVSPRSQSRAVERTLSLIDPSVAIVAGYREPVMRAVAGWARRRGVPVVLLFVSTVRDRPRTWWREIVKRRLLTRYALVAATGQLAEEYAVQLGVKHERIVKLGNVVDNAYFQTRSDAVRQNQTPQREHLALPEAYFLTVSRFSPEKNLLALLKAFFEYQRSGGSWNLVLVGSGPQEHQLHDLVRDYALQGVHFVPWKAYEELPSYYALASCFVLPSLSEPWGLVVNEAMACGLPVLVSRNCGCVPELCREGENGCTFDPASTGELTELMLRISSSNGDLAAMGQASRRIIASFTPQTWAAKLRVCVMAARELQ